MTIWAFNFSSKGYELAMSPPTIPRPHVLPREFKQSDSGCRVAQRSGGYNWSHRWSKDADRRSRPPATLLGPPSFSSLIPSEIMIVEIQGRRETVAFPPMGFMLPRLLPLFTRIFLLIHCDQIKKYWTQNSKFLLLF